jgi:hypothetical protein
MRATIDRQNKELAKRRQTIAENEENDSATEDDRNGRGDVESQDEEDMGFGTRPGGGFTSVVSIPPLERTTVEINVHCRSTRWLQYHTGKWQPEGNWLSRLTVMRIISSKHNTQSFGSMYSAWLSQRTYHQ